jgi:hypothetical protein
MLQTMGIMHTSRSRVDSLEMPIGSCRPRPRLIDWFAMPYSSSRGVHPCPKQNTRKILRMEDRHILGVKKNYFTPKNLMNNLQEHARICISLSQKSNQCCKQLESCTFLDRRWSTQECQLVRVD